MNRFLSIVLLLVITSCQNYADRASGLFLIRESGKYGYINSRGEVAIPPKFDEAKRFSEGLAAIRIDSLWGFVDTTGLINIEPQFYAVEEFSDGMCKVDIGNELSSSQAFINRQGQVVYETNSLYVWDYKGGLARTKIDGLITYLNKKGEIVIKTNFPYGDSFYEGVAKLWTGDSSSFIDTTGKILFKLDGMGHHGFSEGLAAVRRNGKNCYIDKSGTIRIDSLNDHWVYFDFSEGLAQVTIPGPNPKSGFINTSGELVIPMKFSLASSFKEGLASFHENSKWGFIDKNGEIKIPPSYDFIDSGGFSNGLCWAEKDHLGGYINKSGKFIWTEKNYTPNKTRE